jgi:thiosulfate/3-mercaptopyruvate sulfurtransferase
MEPLITTEDLARRLGEPALRIFDCTTVLHPEPCGRMRV